MKILQSPYFRPRHILSENYVDGQYQITSQPLDYKLNASDSPFNDLIRSLMPSLYLGDEFVIKKEYLSDFVQCTDYSVAEYDRKNNLFYANELCYFHPETEFFLLLSENLSDDYSRTIIQSGFLKVERLGYNSSKADNPARIQTFFERYLEKFVSKEGKILLLLKEGADLVFRSHIVKPYSLDLELMYNDDFLPVHNKIEHDLTHTTKGVVLLHGVAGSGKTNYIKWLTTQVPDKNFIFVPNNLIGALAEPQFMSMLIEQHNSVLVLEDCENYIAERAGGGNTSDVVSTILNIADGILSDVLECQFICTFNADLTNVDHALLRQGRLIAEYQFAELTTDKANAYLAAKGNTQRVTRPHTLAEITHLNHDHFILPKAGKSFGFLADL